MQTHKICEVIFKILKGDQKLTFFIDPHRTKVENLEPHITKVKFTKSHRF